MSNVPPILQRKLSAQEAEMYLGPEFMALFRQQLLITCVNRLGGKVELPVSEVDGTGQFMMSMEVDQVAGKFILKTEKKQ